MSYVPYKGATLLVPSGPNGMHLFVVVTNKCAQGFHLLVSITSIKNGRQHDTTCAFQGGEHPFITKPSYVFYRLAEKKLSKTLSSGVDGGLFIPREDIAGEHLQKICDGFDQSDFAGAWAVEYFAENKDN